MRGGQIILQKQKRNKFAGKNRYALNTGHTAGVIRFSVSETAIAKAIALLHNILDYLIKAGHLMQRTVFSRIEINAFVSTRLKTVPS